MIFNWENLDLDFESGISDFPMFGPDLHGSYLIVPFRYPLTGYKAGLVSAMAIYIFWLNLPDILLKGYQNCTIWKNIQQKWISLGACTGSVKPTFGKKILIIKSNAHNLKVDLLY